MDKLMLMNDQLNAVVWGKYMIFFLLFTGFWLMLRTRFLPFTHARLILRKTLGSLGKGDKGDGVTPFQAVATALAGTLGVGSVVGVTTALTMGGPGALLWMCVSAIFRGCACHPLSYEGTGWHLYRRTDDNTGERLPYGLSRYFVCRALCFCILWYRECHAGKYDCTYDHILYFHTFLEHRAHHGAFYCLDHIRKGKSYHAV